MSGATKKAIDAWYDDISISGDLLVCVENQVWNPERAAERLLGQRFEYVSGKNSIRLRRLGDGEEFWLNRPKRVRDVVSLSDEQITYVIRDGLTATWRKEGGAR